MATETGPRRLPLTWIQVAEPAAVAAVAALAVLAAVVVAVSVTPCLMMMQ